MAAGQGGQAAGGQNDGAEGGVLAVFPGPGVVGAPPPTGFRWLDTAVLAAWTSFVVCDFALFSLKNA